jgi:acyl-CoA synthetase (AMP-forming)/AMP-acid ligase II
LSAGAGRSRTASGDLAPPLRVSELAARGAARHPDAPALVAPDGVLTYLALAHAVDGAAAALHDLGVRAGDRVLVVNENCAAALVLALATTCLDAWPVLLNARLSAREIEAIRAHCAPRRVLFTTAVSVDAARHAERLGGQALALPGLAPVAVGPLDARAAVEQVTGDPSRQVAALIYTTGTTGAPKGVLLSHRNLLFAAVTGATIRRLGPGDRSYAALPISHVFGLASVGMSALLAGAALHLVPRFTAAGLADALERDGISVLPGVPAMYTRLIEYARAAGRAIRAPRLHFAYAGGAPLDPALKAEVEALFGLPLHNGYGLTETSPTVSSTLIDAPRSDLSVGPPVPGIEVRIAGAGGVPLARGAVGELHVRGPNIMLGYYREPALTAQAIDRDGWFNTGDLARQDVDDHLFIVGRTKELIIRSGFNVYPVEVESVLGQHPAVAQAAVVGRAVPGNEEVVAFVELRTGAAATPEALHAFAAARLAPYKVPAQIVVMAALPASATGKVLKGRLRELAQAGGPAPSRLAPG